MMDISFKLDPEIIIGSGTINRAGAICKNIHGGRSSGGQALVAADKELGGNQNVERLSAVLADSGVEVIVFDDIPPQATADTAEAAAELARGSRCTAIIGFGGPVAQSVARTAAIIAQGGITPGELLDGEKPSGPPLPYIAIPTTARDPFVLTDSFIAVDPRDRSVKLIPSPGGLCAAAVFDSGIAESPSGKFAAASFFDGFCAAVEAYCSVRAQFMSDILLEEALRFYIKAMDACANKQLEELPDAAANAGFLMALGSMLSPPGIGTALAYSLSGRFPVAKSWCAAALLPAVMERLVAVRPEKIAAIAAIMGESAEGASTADAAAMAVAAIRRRLETLETVSRLKDFNLSLDRLVPVAETARNLAFVAHSPWTVTVEEAYGLLKQAF